MQIVVDLRVLEGVGQGARLGPSPCSRGTTNVLIN
jgi:hypothetical protein